MQPIITENREKIAEPCRDAAMSIDRWISRSAHIHHAASFLALQTSLVQLLRRDAGLGTDGSTRNPYLLRNLQSDAQALYAS